MSRTQNYLLLPFAGVLSLAVLGLRADAAQWVIDTSATAAEKTFEGAGDWFTESNWNGGVVASGAGNIAMFWTAGGNWFSGLRYTSLDRNVTLRSIQRNFNNTQTLGVWDANKRVILGGDNVITLDGDGSGVSMVGLRVYASTCINASSSMPELHLVDVCGPFSNSSGKTLKIKSDNNDGMSRFRRDLWADGTSEGITNVAPSVIRFDERTFLGIVAPEGSDGVSGDWNLVEGSPYATFAGETRHAVSVGAVVTGGGVPTGAYVKRIYPDGRIELSQAATATATETLAFGAFRPKMYQRLTDFEYEYHSSASLAVGVWPMKHSEADEMTVEVNDLGSPGSRYSFYVDVEDGFLPGRLILRKTSSFTNPGVIFLGTCEVEFAEPTTGTAGFRGVVQMRTGEYGADDVATIVVGDGVTATIGTLTNVTGRLVKKGAGALSANVPNAAQFAPRSESCLAVEEGTLTLTTPDGADVLEVATVRVASGTTLVLPTNGIKCVSFVAESGATVRGGGLIYTEEGSVEGATLEGGIRFVKAEALKTGDYFWEEQQATVPGNPAAWFDVSSGDSLLTRPVSVGTRYKAAEELVRWADVRGLEYGWATNGTWRAPQLATNSQGVVDHVHFVFTGSGASANRYDLTFNTSKTGVRHVFKVVSLLNGRPQPIGGSILKAERSRTVFDSAALSIPSGNEWLSNTVFRVNGAKGNWRNGYPYRGGIVGNADADTANVTPFEKLVKTVVEFAVPAPGVSATRIADNGAGGGRERLYECIVYTNALTEAESAQVTRYLMEKWMGTDANWAPGEDDEVATVDTDTTTDVYQAAGDVMAVGSLAGSGVLEKNGAGELYVADSAGTASLRANAGTVHLRSMALTIDGVRGNPYLHLDASNADSFTSMSGDSVLGWRDARGEGYVTATAIGTRSTAWPKRVANALNGMSAVDFYTCYQKRNSSLEYSPGLGFPVVSNAHCVVGVWNTAGGGGPIIGWKNTGESYFPTSGSSIGFAMGIYRDSFGGTQSSYSSPIVATSNTFRPEQYGSAIARGGKTGGTRTRMNGVDVAAESTGFTGGWDLFSFACYDNIGASALQQMAYSTTYIIYGGAKIAETFLYTNTPPREKILRLEAYLRQKWFNEETPRYRPARFDSLEVAAGAVVSVWGGAAVEVNTLRVDGTLTGNVSVVDNGEIVVTVANDGAVTPLGVTGSVKLAGGGTLRLACDGVAKLQKGTVPLFALEGAPGGVWTIAAPNVRNSFRLTVEDGSLVLTVIPKGTTVIFR